MKRLIRILVCLLLVVSLGMPVNAAPILPADALITPTLPGTVITPVLPDVTLPIRPDTPVIPGLVLFLAPSELKTTEVKYNSVSLQWKDNTSTETKFVLERKTSSGDYTQLAVLSADATTYTDTTVDKSTTYYYRVKAGKGTILISTYTDYSDELKVSTPAASLQLGKPLLDLDKLFPGGLILPTEEDPTEPDTTEEVKAPEALKAETENASDIALTWDDKSDNEEGFLLYRAATGDWEQVAVLDPNEEEYVDENLQPDTTYYYVIFACKENIASAQSNMVEIQTPKETPATTTAQATDIAAPQSLSAKAQNSNETLLTWEDKSINEEGFLLYRTATGDWEEAAKLNSNVTTYSDKAVKANTKYYYVLYAYAGETISKESNVAEVTTPSQTTTPATVDYSGASSWALAELTKSVEYGLYTDKIMQNYTQNITREEFCELAIKLYEKLKATETAPVSPNPFKDTSNASILKAFGAGIVKGTSADTFSPGNSITRQDICVMLYRAITGAVPNVDSNITGVAAFADENLIGSWAINEVKFAFKNSIMKGVGANKIGPRDNTSREQALILIKRVYEAFNIN